MKVEAQQRLVRPGLPKSANEKSNTPATVTPATVAVPRSAIESKTGPSEFAGRTDCAERNAAAFRIRGQFIPVDLFRI
jgi:hypothetical protein